MRRTPDVRGEGRGSVTILAVRVLGAAATLAAWQIMGGLLVEFGHEASAPEYGFGVRQMLMLLGASALSVLTAGAPLGRGKWLVPGVVLAAVGLIAGGTAYATSLAIGSVEVVGAGELSHATWTGRFSGVLFCLIPITVYLAAVPVRLRGMPFLPGVAVLAAASVTVPGFALLAGAIPD